MRKGNYLRAEVVIVPDTDSTLEKLPLDIKTDSPDFAANLVSHEAMARSLKQVFKGYLLKDPKLSKELGAQIDQMTGRKTLVDVKLRPISPFDYHGCSKNCWRKRIWSNVMNLLVDKLVNEIQVLRY